MGDRQGGHRELLAGDPERREPRQEAADAEQELDAQQRAHEPRDGRRHRVAGATKLRGHDRNQPEHEHRPRQVEIDPPGVGQERAEDDLRVDESGREHGQSPQCRLDRRGSDTAARSRQKRDHREQREEGLGQTPVEDRERVLEQDDAEPAEHALRDDDGHGDEPELPQPAAFTPEGPGQGQSEHADERAHQPVAVLVEDAAHHARPREEHHVVAERARPVGHRESRARVRDQSSEEDEDTRRAQGGERQTIGQRLFLDQCRRAPAAPTGGVVCGRKSSRDSGELYS